ncbi:MAG: IS982 family transposase [Candidatus Berkelbacteria bacterium]|nr:IS982 family transposase [Candidatus Berkelbacteria bacterium]
MLKLQSHHITDLYVLVDDLLPKQDKSLGGRPCKMSDSELITALVWSSLSAKQKTIKDIHNCLLLYHQNDFKKIPHYSAFVDHCLRLIPLLAFVIKSLLLDQASIRFMDSTMLEVCKYQRANEHKVCKGLAKFGKNWQGWHFGFKLHASIDFKGRLCGFVISPANTHDSRAEPYLLNKHTKLAVGDTTYGGKAMNDFIFERYGTIVVAPPHPKQNKKLMTKWQQFFLNMRSKIEATFDYLKNHLNLVSSFPRSPRGYLFHWLRTILGYQMITR